ncbi:hypothetical protein QQS21_006699 [Conoideocrella luteorostrata]|uniref:DUF1941-domain-containing protein n=1 Tax=Conoideocrella luteorostrata TaxID=1105319 RepID=A0AAJ0FY20_9HYPO|nr:hypothetical protein QQS21_006699 [Conoideocrella luteorostrata]
MDHAATILRIKAFLEAKDDTQRFVGLALFKSVLDNTPELRQDEVIQDLWASVSPKFLDRLIKTGSQTSGENVKEMLDLSVSVIHTFVALLPESAKAELKLTDRIPRLVGAVLYSLVSTTEGAKSFIKVEDVSSLAEIAPTHPIVLEIYRFAWLNGMAAIIDRHVLVNQVTDTMQFLVASFTGTDGVTLLEFLGSFLRQADPTIIPHEPQWLQAVVGFIQTLVTSRPNMAARSAYTNASASVLQAYPESAPKLLFTDNTKDEKPFAYLLINLLLIDIRTSAPTLLEQLNRPEYAKLSQRQTSAYDVISIFIGHLVRCLEDDSTDTFPLSPDNLLKLRKGISETMSVTVEYLRDRWDASFAGAMGLHPDARVFNTETATGSHRTLAWDSMADSADEDPLILSALRALSLWLREDENEMLRKEATGLTDMYLELYQSSSSERLDFRSATLVGLEALLTLEEGRELFLREDGWKCLSQDLITLLQQPSPKNGPDIDPSRGIEIVRVLLSVAEAESFCPEEWMDVITVVAAWDPTAQDQPQQDQPQIVQEFQVAIFQLCCALLTNASSGMRERYKQSTVAILRIATRVIKHMDGEDESSCMEAMRDVEKTLLLYQKN